MDKIKKVPTAILKQILRATIEDQDYMMLSDEHKEWANDSYMTSAIWVELKDRDADFWFWEIYMDE